MNPATTVAADPPVGGRRSLHGWRIVAALAVTQTVGYGTLYYTFAVLLQPMAATLHASTTTVTGALTASILAGAVMAVPVGRWLDRHGGRALMTAGSVAATGLLVAWSQVRTVAQLYAVLIGVGLTSAMVLYESAFAVVVSWFDPQQRAKALLTITIVAGFASAVFLPLTGALVQRYGWQHALLILAALHGVLTVPLHGLVVRRAPHLTTARQRDGASRSAVVRAALHDSRFWALGVAFVAHGAAMTAMTVHLVGFLTSRGHPVTFAATVAGLLGVLSVTGRLVLTGAQRRIRITTVVAVIYTVQAAAALTLLAIGGSRAGAVTGVVAFGLGFGISSLASPALLADRYGTIAYASIAGILAVPITLARAGAPLGAAALHTVGGYAPVLTAIGVACLIAATGIATRASAPPPVPDPHAVDDDQAAGADPQQALVFADALPDEPGAAAQSKR
ncbi:MFS transporter [Dactylosporangium sp. NPDC005555]|uniref:MFS transporter n=1 Tax=Dactylosporangium sp. NPDC005555 TaxID=3154889 RepID=UPI0033A7E859